MKPKFIIAYMNVAEEFAKLSSARRLHVGCVIVKNDSIIGVGYNGTPKGWDNNCEDDVYDRETGRDLLVTKPEVLHAETNAIAKVAKSTNSTLRSCPGSNRTAVPEAMFKRMPRAAVRSNCKPWLVSAKW